MSKLERYRRPDGSLGLRNKVTHPTAAEQAELKAVTEKFRQLMGDATLSEESRLSRARAFAQGFNVDPLTRSLAAQIATVGNANDTIRAAQAEIQSIQDELGSAVMGRADGHRGRALERIEVLQQKIARAKLDTIQAANASHERAAEEYLEESRAAKAEAAKQAEMQDAIDKARTDVAAEVLAARAREIAEAEASHGKAHG